MVYDEKIEELTARVDGVLDYIEKILKVILMHMK